MSTMPDDMDTVIDREGKNNSDNKHFFHELEEQGKPPDRHEHERHGALQERRAATVDGTCGGMAAVRELPLLCKQGVEELAAFGRSAREVG